MRSLLLIAVLSLAISQGSLLGYSSSRQELFLYRHKLTVVHDLIATECPDYVAVRRETVLANIGTHIEILREQYHRLFSALLKCRSSKVSFSTTTLHSAATDSTPAASTNISYKDCQQLYRDGYNISGVYQISIPNAQNFSAWCDFFDNHGWTVIQKRIDGSVDFNRNWNEYKNGFGSTATEYWLGNDRIHALTHANHMLNVEVIRNSGRSESVLWRKFQITDEADKYRLMLETEGPVGFANHTGSRFSTKDQDNDLNESYNFAAEYQGGWWFTNGYTAYLNGVYGRRVFWNGGDIKSTVMRVTRD